MNSLKNLIGRQVLSIQRLDSSIDYEFYSPYAIILTIEGFQEKLILNAANDNSSVDIRMTIDEQIEIEYEFETNEHIKNDLKKDDELNYFLGNKIQDIRLAEFILPEIQGDNFIILQGKYAAIELKTDKHILLFRNNYGGWYDIDDDISELSNKERYQWK